MVAGHCSGSGQLVTQITQRLRASSPVAPDLRRWLANPRRRVMAPQLRKQRHLESAMRPHQPQSILALGFAGLSLWGRHGWLVTGLGALAAFVLWCLGRCTHPRPLGLLPPVTDEHGHRTPAQWYCGQCGKRFPAQFEHDRTPIQRFSGYDESKAREAARRAADLDGRRRQLAVRRAGLTRSPEPEHDTVKRSGPVPIRGGRLAG